MRAVLIATAFVLTSTPLFAQTLDPAFEKARAARAAAIVANDREAFLRYTTDDFIYVSLDGKAMTRDARAAANQSNAERPARQPLTEAKVRVFGDTIITSGRGAFNINGITQPVRVLQVWVKRDDEWKVAHAQNTPIVTEKR